MDNAFAMAERERSAKLGVDVGDFVSGEWLGRVETGCERSAAVGVLYQFHCEPGATVVRYAEVEHLDEVGVVERGESGGKTVAPRVNAVFSRIFGRQEGEQRL